MLVIFLVAVIFLLIYFCFPRYNYWKEKGVKHDKTVPIFGTNAKLSLNQTNIAHFYQRMYYKYPTEKIIGYYEFARPGVLIRDPNLANKILSTDFQSFHERGLIPKKWKLDNQPLLKNLFTVEGDTWKLLRQKLSLMFSSRKLKAMFPLIVERAEKLQKLAENAAINETIIDIKDLMARYTTDFIGACAFGIDMDSLDNDDSEFRKLGKRIFDYTSRDIAAALTKSLSPVDLEGLKLLSPEIENGIKHLMNEVIKRRNNKPSGRNDFIDILLDIRENGAIIGESIEKRNFDGKPVLTQLEIDEDLMAAQMFLFFAAGFETSSSSSSYTLHQLAYNPEEQKKVQEEIDRVLLKYGNISYEAINSMQYLEMALKESLRLLPPLGILNRRSTCSYTFPGTNITIDKGISILIPVYAYHHDKAYFDDPEEFQPMRFHPSNISKINKHAYLPFGDGYRSCIGERLGLMQTMAGLAAILHKYEVLPAPTSIRHPKLSNSFSITQSIEGGLPLLLRCRQK